MASVSLDDSIRYEPDEPCPPLVAVGVGAQGVLLVLAPIVLIVAVSALASGHDEQYLTWAVFVALIVSGLSHDPAGGAVWSRRSWGTCWLRGLPQTSSPSPSSR